MPAFGNYLQGIFSPTRRTQQQPYGIPPSAAMGGMYGAIAQPGAVQPPGAAQPGATVNPLQPGVNPNTTLNQLISGAVGQPVSQQPHQRLQDLISILFGNQPRMAARGLAPQPQPNWAAGVMTGPVNPNPPAMQPPGGGYTDEYGNVF